MLIQSVNLGLPKAFVWQGKPVLTGIFKEPVMNPVHVHSLGVDGDGQADLRYHGGVDKAVYAYDQAHYDHWRTVLPEYIFTPANFGENLTTSGLIDADVHIGDEFRIGSAVLRATQPRFPCAKLGLRFGDPAMVTLFKKTRRHGIYFRVVKPGQIQPGDAVELVRSSAYSITVQDVVDAFYQPDRHTETVDAILAISEFPALLRQHFAKFADK